MQKNYGLELYWKINYEIKHFFSSNEHSMNCIFIFNAILLAHILDMHQLNYTSFAAIVLNTYRT